MLSTSCPCSCLFSSPSFQYGSESQYCSEDIKSSLRSHYLCYCSDISPSPLFSQALPWLSLSFFPFSPHNWGQSSFFSNLLINSLLLLLFSIFPDWGLHPAAHEALTTNEIWQAALWVLRQSQTSWALIQLLAAEEDAQEGMTALESNKSSKGNQWFFHCNEKGL